MGLLSSLSNLYSTGNAQGATTGNNTHPSNFKNIVDILQNMMMSQPGYQKNFIGQQQAQAMQLANQNTPIANQLKNMLSQGNIEKLGIENAVRPQMLQADIGSKNAIANYKLGQLQYLPMNMQIKQMNADINNRRFSPEQLAALLKWREMNTQTGQVRSLSATGKEILEEQNLRKNGNIFPNPPGYTPPSVQPAIPQQPNMNPGQNLGASSQQASAVQPLLSPDKANDAANAYELIRQKRATDPKNREAVLKAKQVETTLNAVDFNAVKDYFGPKGRIKLANDFASSMAGKTSPQYEKYVRFSTVQAPEVAKQMRAYFIDSVQPQVAEKYEALIVPEFWKNNPERAMIQFDEFVNLFKRDSAIRIKAMKDSSVYTTETDLRQPIPKANSVSSTAQHTKEDALAELKRRGKL